MRRPASFLPAVAFAILGAIVGALVGATFMGDLAMLAPTPFAVAGFGAGYLLESLA